MASLMSLPSRKLCVHDIQCSRDTANPSQIRDLHVWKFDGPEIKLTFSVVWIQGNIIEIQEDKGTFTIDDSTGIIEVVRPDNVVQAQKNLCKGQYVMVIGEVLQVGRHAVMKAMKIQDLSKDKSAQSIWTSEVKHQKAFLGSHCQHGEVGLEG